MSICMVQNSVVATHLIRFRLRFKFWSSKGCEGVKIERLDSQIDENEGVWCWRLVGIVQPREYMVNEVKTHFFIEKSRGRYPLRLKYSWFTERWGNGTLKKSDKGGVTFLMLLNAYGVFLTRFMMGQPFPLDQYISSFMLAFMKWVPRATSGSNSLPSLLSLLDSQFNLSLTFLSCKVLKFGPPFGKLSW